jgi:hypothetical protein
MIHQDALLGKAQQLAAFTRGAVIRSHLIRNLPQIIFSVKFQFDFGRIEHMLILLIHDLHDLEQIGRRVFDNTLAVVREEVFLEHARTQLVIIDCSHPLFTPLLILL